MALSFTNVVEKTPIGCQNEVFGVVDITLDDSYPDGGWAIAASDLDLESIHILSPQATSAGGTVLFFNVATSKLLAYEADGDAGALVACVSADDLNDGDVVRCFYMGTN